MTRTPVSWSMRLAKFRLTSDGTCNTISPDFVSRTLTIASPVALSTDNSSRRSRTSRAWFAVSIALCTSARELSSDPAKRTTPCSELEPTSVVASGCRGAEGFVSERPDTRMAPEKPRLVFMVVIGNTQRERLQTSCDSEGVELKLAPERLQLFINAKAAERTWATGSLGRALQSQPAQGPYLSLNWLIQRHSRRPRSQIGLPLSVG